MRLIPLWQKHRLPEGGYGPDQIMAYAKVDECFYDRVVSDPPSGKWRLQVKKYGGKYAMWFGHANGHTVHHRLYHLVLILAGKPIPPGMQPDHIDRDGLNNQLSNLRVVSPRRNNHNRGGKWAIGPSGFRGVSWHKEKRKWQAYINHRRGHKRALGYYSISQDAARAYDSAVCEIGEQECSNAAQGLLSPLSAEEMQDCLPTEIA